MCQAFTFSCSTRWFVNTQFLIFFSGSEWHALQVAPRARLVLRLREHHDAAHHGEELFAGGLRLSHLPERLHHPVVIHGLKIFEKISISVTIEKIT